ncbi:MAG: M56 family metallopeptidase, partial [Oscillospiraceae bacterium]|nr:M56 family metallopeptidase [Oscillospiraceae bacterium]
TEMIVTSSVLILLLAALRRVLRGRISQQVQYALWVLAAARLLSPGTLFTVPVSITGATEGLQASIHEVFPDPDDLPEPATNDILDQLPSPSPAQPPQADHPDADVAVTRRTVPPAVAQRIYNWPDIIWKTGMAVTGGILVLSNLAFSLRLRKSRVRLDLPAAPWSGKLAVYEADGLASPCLSGLFRPAIYLNEAAMDAEHPQHILAHEYAHYRHGDHVWAVLRCVCLAVHWYNPLVWWAAALSRRDCELACDAAALKRLGEEERIDYGQTLLGMVSRGRSPAALLRAATTMTAGKRAMKERIALIIKQPRMRKTTLISVLLAVCLLVSCSFGGRDAGTNRTDPSQLLEFPGLHWNDSVETVIEALGITEEQILENGVLAGEDVWCLAAGDIPGFGGTAEKAYFNFERYEGSEWGLYSVRLDYPNDADFGAVREEMARQYGPGSESSADSYSFTSGGALQITQPAQSDFQQQLMLGIYGQEMMDRRSEIRGRPGSHSWHWSLESAALPEEFLLRAPGWLAENSYTPVPLETAQEYFRLEPMVRVFWTDAAPLNWSRLSTTLNQVCLDASSYVYFLQRITAEGPAAADPARDSLTDNARSIVEQIQSGADVSEWLPLMNYMDWGVLAQAAVEAGMDEGDGSMAVTEYIMGAIDRYIEQQGPSMTQAEYLYLLSATAGLDGAPAEGYAYTIYRMYAMNPSQFAYVVLEMLPETQRNEALYLFCFEWDYHRISDSPEPPTREEAIAQLEADLEAGISASPSEEILYSPGSTFQFHLVNGSGIYALTYISSDTGVAEVDENGVVTAVGPGEAVITMHYEGAGGSLDFNCRVVCQWENTDTPEPAGNG